MRMNFINFFWLDLEDHKSRSLFGLAGRLATAAGAADKSGMTGM